ncbi:hypothetical protein ACV216_003012, partial [Escherichia coli]
MSTGLRFTLEVDGLPPDAFAVVSFHLNQLLSSLFSLDLSLVSQQFLSLEFAQVLDKMAYLTIWQGDEVQRRVTDGAGRRFHLVLTTQAQRAEVFRKQRATSLSSPAGPRSASSSLVFPDTLPAGTGYGTDNGIRLEAVWLTHDPAYPDEQPTAPLARYTYTAGGELRAVYDRSG